MLIAINENPDNKNNNIKNKITRRVNNYYRLYTRGFKEGINR